MTSVATRRLDHDVDLLEVAGETGWAFVKDGHGVAGRGELCRVRPDGVADALAPLGEHATAIGARPFRPDATWELVIPRYQVRIDDDGTAWETVIGDEPVAPPISLATRTGAVRSVAVDDPDDWCDAVARATAHIRAGDADKIVLAREVRAEAEQPLSALRLAMRLRERFPGCFLFSVDGLVGASPELLVRRRGEVVSALPMAGTARRSDDPVVDARRHAELFASTTYRHEHQVTIDMVHDTLLAYASYIDFEPEPTIVDLPNVAHLATHVEGRLSHPPASVLELQDALHPTPAVSGRPRDAAIRLIAELEGRDRGRYAGTVGWTDAAGDGDWAVTLRCAQIDPDDPRRARVQAGCGLVADSDPRTELAESEAKLQAVWPVLGD
jgi:menaquinone-specific isochorismate synthase